MYSNQKKADYVKKLVKNNGVVPGKKGKQGKNYIYKNHLKSLSCRASKILLQFKNISTNEDNLP